MSDTDKPAESVDVDAESPLERLLTRSGALAELWRQPQGEVLAVRDARGALLLELHEAEGRVVLYAPEGDLELRAPKGRVIIAGQRGVQIEGDEVRIKAKRLVHAAELIETHAGRILEKAEDVFRDVRGLHRLRAQDVRISAKRAFRSVAKRIRMRAKKDVKIDGEKIFLG